MKKWNILFSLIFNCWADDWITSTKAHVSGSFRKLDSWYEKIEVPDIPILAFSIEIDLKTSSLDLDEYPYPVPMAYIGANLNPELTFDYSIDLSSFSGNFSTTSFLPASFLIVRIDGGFNSTFPMTPNYSPAKWKFEIKAEFMHCSSKLFTSIDRKQCNIPITNSKVNQSWVARIIEVPLFTKEFLVTGKNLTISRNFFEFYESGSNEISLDMPHVGFYYIIGFEEINYEIFSNELNADGQYFNYKEVYNLGEIPYGSDVKLTIDYSCILIISVTSQDIKYLFDFQYQNCLVYPTFWYQDFDATKSLGYLRKGTYFIYIGVERFGFGNEIIIRKVVLDDKKCKGHEAELVNDLVYVCDCSGQYTGRNCEVASVSDFKYFIGLICLAGSNFAMIPAIRIGYLREAYGEIVIFTGNMISSVFYHICDYHFYCFGLKFKYLHTLDFIFSNFSVLISFLYLIRIQNSNLKLGLYCGLFIFLSIVGTGVGFNGFVFEILVMNN